MTRFSISFVLLVLVGSASAQQRPIPANGTEILRGLLKYQGFKPMADTRRFNPDGTLLVIVGKPLVEPQFTARTSEVILRKKGGLLLIADELIPLNSYLPIINNLARNTSITGLRVNCNRPEHCFNGSAQMPFARFGGGGVVELQALGALDRVATRNPSTMISPPGAYLGTELMKLPPGSRFAGVEVVPDTALLGAMSDPQLPSTAMVFANRAMFTNELMVAKDANGQPGTQNFLFAYFLTAFLKSRIAGPNDSREVLFVEDGQIVTDFDSVSFAQGNVPPNGIPPVMPPLPVLLAFAFEKGNDIVAQAEDKDLPHALLKGNAAPVTASALATIAVIASIVLCWYLMRRAWRLRQLDTVVPRPKIEAEGDGGMMTERRLGLLDSGNLFEPMRDYLRVLFKQWGADSHDPALLPLVELDRPTRPAQRIVADLHLLWKIAYDTERKTITLDEMEEFEDMIQDLTRARTKGIWQFAANSGGEA